MIEQNLHTDALTWWESLETNQKFSMREKHRIRPFRAIEDFEIRRIWRSEGSPVPLTARLGVDRVPTKVRAPKPPEGRNPIERYLTPGKEYGVSKFRKKENDDDTSEGSFYVIDDENQPCYCLLKGCGHLGGLDWIVTESETAPWLNR